MNAPWTPTPHLLQAVTIRPFIPTHGANTPKKLVPYLRSIYPGELVYVFETLANGSTTWARGYNIQKPLPSDYSSDSVDVKKLPENLVSISIFPMSCVKVLKNIDPNTDEVFSNDSSTFDSSAYDEYDEYATDSESIAHKNEKKQHRPPLPLNTELSTSDLAAEIKLTLNTISSTIFAVYSKSNFEFFNKLTIIYYELDDLRISLTAGLLTKREENMSRKKVYLLMSKFSKLLASGGGLINRSKHSKSDLDGRESIIARDEQTAELFNPGEGNSFVNPAKISQSQAFSALSPKYPWGQSASPFIPEKNSKFEGTPPSNILVDVKRVVGSSTVVPRGYAGMKAYMYLRDTRKRLTEAFAISILPDQDFTLDNLAAALFTNIPAMSVDSGRVFLVALITETIQNHKSTGIEVHKTLPVIRKGICAGVADISRIFSRRKGHLVSGKAHRFSIKLYSSYLDSNKQEVKLYHGMNSMMAKSMTMVNNGWGELVDRIISGSNKGVAVNPRAERLILSIKELRLSSDNKKVLDSLSSTRNSALACIPMLYYNPLEKDSDRIFLRLMKTTVTGMNLKEKSYITVHLKASNKSIKFAKGTNEPLASFWRFLSVSPEESIHELISVRGFSKTPDSGSDFLIFDTFVNDEFFGEARYLLRNGSIMNDTGIFSKVSKIMDVVGADGSKISIEMDLEYVGKTYNVETNGERILKWKSLFGADLKKNEAVFIDLLSKLRRLKPSTLIGKFSEFCFALTTAYQAACDLKLERLSYILFESLVQLLDVAVARNEEYVSIFETMIDEHGSQLPKVGEKLLSSMVNVFSIFETDWTATGRALCRVSILVLRIASKCFSNVTEYKEIVTRFTLSITNFLSSGKETLIADQLLIIETLELYLDLFKSWFSISEICDFASSWISANKMRGLGFLEDSNANALVNKKRDREHRFIIYKLLFANRLMNSFIMSNGTSKEREKMLAPVFDFVLSVICNDSIDLECSRLSLSILLSICNTSYGSERLYHDESLQLYMTLVKSIPLLSKQFCRYFEFCSSRGLLDSKRTFTDLFPNCFPFNDYPMDSIVSDISLAEVLVEFTVVFSFITKMYEQYSKEFLALNNQNTELLYLNSGSNIEWPKLESMETVQSITETANLIATAAYYPSSTWLSLHAVSLNCSYLLLNLVNNFIPEPETSNLSIWHQFLSTLMDIATSKPSSVEHLDATPRKASHLLIGDLRSQVAPFIDSSWDKLGDNSSLEDQARFQMTKLGRYQPGVISLQSFDLFEKIMLLSMQRSHVCLHTGVKILWCVIASELTTKEALFDLERQTTTSLYELFDRENIYTPQATEIKSFVDSMHKIIKKMDPEDADITEVLKFAKKISRYLASLAELKKVPAGEEFDDDRTFHRLNISSYLMNVDRPELFQSFINDMYESNLSKKNFVQAALSLELLANTYDWDIHTYLPACAKPKLPRQTAFKRKVDLFKTISSNFVLGNKLEQAVDIYSEMLNAYNNFNFDLAGLSFCHSELGKLYGSLENVDRLESTFFKISFIGFGFPESIRGKNFVYEGLPYEHITSINNRLTRLYPGSKIISNDDEAKKLLKDTPIGKFLHIKTVLPSKNISNNELSFMARQYVENKNLNTFLSTRRLPGASSIANLWTEETTYITYMTFPTLMNRSEIKSTTTIKIPPIKNAIRSLEAKNNELSNIEFLINQNLKDNHSLQSIGASTIFNNLTRILSGTVDSPVNGGAGEFKVFLTGSKDVDIGESSDLYEQDCEILKDCFSKLIVLLNRLLKIHGLIVPVSFKLQHESLVELFSKNFFQEIEELKLDVTTPLDYDKLMHSLTATNVHSKHRPQESTDAINYFETRSTKSSSHSTIPQSPRLRTPSVNSNHHHQLHNNHSHHHQRNGGLLIGSSRHSLRDDVSGISNDTHNTKKTAATGKKNILNYK